MTSILLLIGYHNINTEFCHYQYLYWKYGWNGFKTNRHHNKTSKSPLFNFAGCYYDIFKFRYLFPRQKNNIKYA